MFSQQISFQYWKIFFSYALLDYLALICILHLQKQLPKITLKLFSHVWLLGTVIKIL